MRIPMTHHGCNALATAALIAVAVSIASVPTAGQGMYDRPTTPRQLRAPAWVAEKATQLPFETPRTPWGEPDFRGSWGTQGVSSDNIERIEDWLDPATPPTETMIIDPPDGKVPYTPWALAERNRFRAALARGWPGETGERLYLDPQTFCSTGLPRIAWRGAWQIMQTPGYVFLNLGWGHSYRVIPTDGRQDDLSKDVKLWLGRPRGHWEGNTLVVETTNLNGKQWFDSYANFLSENTRIVERWTLVRTVRPGGGERVALDWQATMHDPTIYTRPWTMNLPLFRQSSPEEMWEHTCHEGNALHIEEAKRLGFQWFWGVVPPGSSNR